MAELMLIRHAQNDWVRSGKLAGWTPEVHLNDEGRQQAERLGQRLAAAKLDAIYSSPLVRAVETAEAVIKHHPNLSIHIEEGVGEVHFGDWTGKRLQQLARTRLWQVVQHAPSVARFPNGESFREMQQRAVGALEAIAARHAKGRVAVFSHSDVLKAVMAHFLGVPLDLFQRINISPASLSIVYLGPNGVFIGRMNDTGHLEMPASQPSAKE